MVSPIEEVKNRLDIVEVISSYIKLKKAGANFKALCPFHSEKTPSFFVSPSRQIWHCFGCGLGGDVFGFIKQIEGVEFGDALRILARRAGVELKRESPELRTERQRLYEICELSCRFFQKQLEKSSTGKAAKQYLLGRTITKDSIEKWRLGYAPDTWEALSDFLVSRGYKREEIRRAGLAIKSEKRQKYFDRFRGRIIFPIFDLNSQVIGFGARIFQKKDPAKYLNTPNTLLYDKSRILYGLNQAKLEIRKKNFCLLVEGYVDVILSNQAGFKNIVAISGTALSPFQLKTLKRYSDNLLTAFDMDMAGSSATKRGIDLALSQGFDIKVVRLPEGLDPADVISKNPADWEKLLLKPQSILDFYFESTLSGLDPKTPEGRKKASKTLLPVIKKIPNKIEQSFWVQKLAKILEIEETAVAEELKRTKTTGAEGDERPVFTPPKKSRRELLEEDLICLALGSIDFFNRLKKENFKDFLSPRFCQIVNHFNSVALKEKGVVFDKSVLTSKEGPPLPPDLEEFLNYLLLKSDMKKKQVPKIEFRNCLKEIKHLAIKERLSEISKNIKTAETQNDTSKTQRLLEEFNRWSKELCALEG